jgi:hypothetical protein
MPQYAIHDASGRIDRVLDIPDEDLDAQLQEGEIATPTDGSCRPWHAIDVQTSTIIRHDPEEEPQRTVSDVRAQAYPPIGEQLDMLWHAMDAGEIPKATAFYERIKAVKDALPHDGPADAALVETVVAVQVAP